MDSSGGRLTRHDTVRTALASMSDAEIVTALGRPDHDKRGIGGSTRTIRTAGAQVFVKLVTLTDAERDVGPGCTGNIFDLPTWYQYGVGEGSTGFNAWREVAAHQIVSDWVVDGSCAHFPVLYHWRELPWPAATGQAVDVDRAVRFWRGSRAVERRMRALDESSSVVALFLEHVPFTLRGWLAGQLAAGPAQADAAVTLVDQQLLAAVQHLRAAGMTHFDAHFDNVLTEGHGIYLSDFGLATAHRFQLNAAERRFVQLTDGHDLAYCTTALVNAIVGSLPGLQDARLRNAYVRRCADSGRAEDVTGRAAEIVLRYAGIATVVNDFYWQLHAGEQTTAYPADAIAAALASAGMTGTGG